MVVVFSPHHSHPFTAPFPGHPYQRLQLPVVNEAELLDEVVKVLVACVDVSLGAHVDDAVEVVDVDVDKDAEEAGEDLSANLLELLGEGNTCEAKARWKPFEHFSPPQKKSKPKQQMAFKCHCQA